MTKCHTYNHSTRSLKLESEFFFTKLDILNKKFHFDILISKIIYNADVDAETRNLPLGHDFPKNKEKINCD